MSAMVDHKVVSVAALAVSILTLIVVVYLTVPSSIWLAAEGSLAASSPKCDDGNQCTYDRLSGPAPGYCEHLPYSTDKTCKSNCYAAGTKMNCDGNAGQCTSGDWTACNGYCGATSDIWSGSCDPAIFPFKPYFTTPNSDFDVDALESSADVIDCFASQCVEAVLEVQFSVSHFGDNLWIDWAGAFIGNDNCNYLLDNTTDVDTSCIVSEVVELDSSLFETSIQTALDNTNSNFTARVCVFRYACGQFNSSAFYDPQNLARSAIDADITVTSDNALRVFATQHAVEKLLPRAQKIFAAGDVQKRGGRVWVK